MSIDWSNFTPLASAGGGALIGLSAGVLYLALGRVAGISGILGNLVLGVREGLYWRIAFLVGLLAGPWVGLGLGGVDTGAVTGNFGDFVALFLAGVLTGYGTRNARGCTSGHGVCGLARLSFRSLVAVIGFMATGIFTVTVLRHVFGIA